MAGNPHPDLVDWRKRHGSKCEWCPLNGQRKVGADGPVDAPHVGFGDFPATAETEYGVTRGFKYGRSFSGGAGYFWKLEYLVPNGLAELIRRPGKEWPGVELTKIQLLNVAMCQPEKEKSILARQAMRCCANGLRAWLRRRIAENPDIMLHAVGGPALEFLLRDKAAIDAYRGRLLTALEWQHLLTDEPEDKIMRAVFRAKKPTVEWWDAFEKWLKSFLKLYRKAERHLATAAKKADQATLLEANTWLVDWTKLYKKQLAAVRKAERAAKEAA